MYGKEKVATSQTHTAMYVEKSLGRRRCLSVSVAVCHVIEEKLENFQNLQ